VRTLSQYYHIGSVHKLASEKLEVPFSLLSSTETLELPAWISNILKQAVWLICHWKAIEGTVLNHVCPPSWPAVRNAKGWFWLPYITSKPKYGQSNRSLVTPLLCIYIYIYIYNFGLTALLQVLPQELVIYINTFNTCHTSYYSHTNHYSDTSHCSHSSHRHYYNTKSEHYASTDYTCCGLFCSYVKWSHCTHEPESRLDRMTVPLGSRVQ